MSSTSAMYRSTLLDPFNLTATQSPIQGAWLAVGKEGIELLVVEVVLVLVLAMVLMLGLPDCFWMCNCLGSEGVVCSLSWHWVPCLQPWQYFFLLPFFCIFCWLLIYLLLMIYQVWPTVLPDIPFSFPYTFSSQAFFFSVSAFLTKGDAQGTPS